MDDMDMPENPASPDADSLAEEMGRRIAFNLVTSRLARVLGRGLRPEEAAMVEADPGLWSKAANIATRGMASARVEFALHVMGKAISEPVPEEFENFVREMGEHADWLENVCIDAVKASSWDEFFEAVGWRDGGDGIRREVSEKEHESLFRHMEEHEKIKSERDSFLPRF